MGLLHGSPPSAPLPGWLVLLVAVPGLWAVVGATVVLLDRLLGHLGV